MIILFILLARVFSEQSEMIKSLSEERNFLQDVVERLNQLSLSVNKKVPPPGVVRNSSRSRPSVVSLRLAHPVPVDK